MNRTLGQLSAGDPNQGGSAPYGSETHTQAIGGLVSHGHTVTINDPGHVHPFGIGVGGGGSYTLAAHEIILVIQI